MTSTCFLTRCNFPSVTSDVFLLQLKDNIEKFFTRFLEEGKATVRLKEPAVDICLSKVCISDLCLSVGTLLFVSEQLN